MYHHLALLTSTQQLNLSCNCIIDEGAKSLGPHLAHLTSIQSLYFHHNRIGDDGAKSL